MLGHNDTALKWSFGIEKTKIIYSCSHFANIFANFLQGRVFWICAPCLCQSTSVEDFSIQEFPALLLFSLWFK